MDSKKAYASPAILTEDLLEQTSLACNSTSSGAFNLEAETCEFIPSIAGTFAPGTVDTPCTTSVAKGGAYGDDASCTTINIGEIEQVVVLS